MVAFIVFLDTTVINWLLRGFYQLYCHPAVVHCTTVAVAAAAATAFNWFLRVVLSALLLSGCWSLRRCGCRCRRHSHPNQLIVALFFINIRWGKAPKDEGSGCIPDPRTHLWIRHSLSIYCNENFSEVNSDIVCGTVLGNIAHNGTLAVPAPWSLTLPTMGRR